MPVSPTFPGVYIQEIPSGVRTIAGVSTSVTAFVGFAKTGPVNEAVRIHNFSDYERLFGGLDSQSELSYAVRQFFTNGGSDAFIVRIAKNLAVASLTLKSGTDDVLTVAARQAGAEGNAITVTAATGAAANQFNLSISRGDVVEKFADLTMTDVEKRVNAESALVTVKKVGTTSKVPAAAPTPGSATVALIDAAVKKVGAAENPVKIQFRLRLDGSAPVLIEPDSKRTVTDAADLAGRIQTAVRAFAPSKPAFAGFRAEAPPAVKAAAKRAGGGANAVVAAAVQLRFISGSSGPNSSVSVLPAGGADASVFDFTSLQAEAGADARLTGGDQQPILGNEFQLFAGSQAKGEGIFALDKVDFNLLCLPGVTDPAIFGEASTYCLKRRAFLLVDPPPSLDRDAFRKEFFDVLGRTQNAAVYFPSLFIADPLNDGGLRVAGPSGTLAGLYARTDSSRGVWKAPAGVDASLRGVQALTVQLTDDQNGELNPLGVNCLRNFPATGPVAWGARTRNGDDRASDEYKYIPVRRLALFIEESLFRGTQWVVFEPNDEPLWAQIRLNVGAFMNNLFRQGAFQGTTPREAFFVKCDSETTTQNDINLGIVNILVGFAPLKPAEFVIISLQQMAGQIQV